MRKFDTIEGIVTHEVDGGQHRLTLEGKPQGSWTSIKTSAVLEFYNTRNSVIFSIRPDMNLLRTETNSILPMEVV